MVRLIALAFLFAGIFIGFGVAPVTAQTDKTETSQDDPASSSDQNQTDGDVTANTEPEPEPVRPLKAVEAWKHPLGDMVQGNPESPVIVIEYLSLTCPACAAFHNRGYDYLYETYIKTNKIKFITRELPLDRVALAGATLVRCAPADQQADIISLILKKQQAWRSAENAFGSLIQFLGQAGYTKSKAAACLAKTDYIKAINQSKNAAGQIFGANATPTFYFNGKAVSGVLTPREIDEHIKPLLEEYGIE